MAELPKLSPGIVRLHQLRWNDLIKKYGFTCEHLKWHESRDRRRAASKPPNDSLLPPPSATVGFDHHNHGGSVHYVIRGRSVPFDEWKRHQMEASAARENDPSVIDTIGIKETTGLAKARFSGIVRDYLSLWADTNGNSTEFAKWLDEIKDLVVREVGDLWTGEWPTAWFARACLTKIPTALAPLIEEWSSRASALEMKHLENPHLSLPSLLAGGGDVNFAVTLEQGRQAIGRAQRVLDAQPEKSPSEVPGQPVQAKALQQTMAGAEPPWTAGDDPTAGRLSVVRTISPGEPLFENLPEDDPRCNALVPFFELIETFRVLAAEYPTLSIDWMAEVGKWVTWPPPARAVAEAEGCPSSPGSDLHLKASAGEAGRLLQESLESWFNPGRDPWLDVQDMEPWERCLYAIREFWLSAEEDAEDVGADMDEFAKAAEAEGYWHTHSPQAVGGRVWRKMVKSKKSFRDSLQELGLFADVIGPYEEPPGSIQRGSIKHVFRACAYFCGVLAARRARELKNTAGASTKHSGSEASNDGEVKVISVGGRRCDPQLWWRFSRENTSRTSKFRDFLVYHFANFHIPGPCTSRDVVERISKECRIPIESLPDDLNEPVFSRGQVIYDFAGDAFDKIAVDYDNMQWWLSDNGLNMAIVSATEAQHIPSFDELVGEPTPVPVDTRIRSRQGKTDPVVQRIKKKARELRKAGLDYSSICERLASTERPPRAGWRDIPWPLAYKRHTSAVTKWLSEACADLPSQTRQG